jgi:drug/metabolite transporter (DMT)-like permease
MPAPGAPAADARQQALGAALVAGSAVAYSTAGFFTRLIDTDVWTLLFWRGIFSALFLLGVALVRDGRRAPRLFASLDIRGWGAVGCSTLAMVFYLSALRHTTVADVAIVYATAPLLTAAIARLAIGERASPATFTCSAAALGGVTLMVGGSHLPHGLAGSLLALAMTTFMALMMVLLRGARSAPAVPVACLSSLLSSVVAAPLASPRGVNAGDLAQLALFGVTQLGLGLLLLTAGTRRIAATHAALIGGLDVPLAPLWTWLAFDEVPGTAAIAGGTIVVLAVSSHVVIADRARTRPHDDRRRHRGS